MFHRMAQARRLALLLLAAMCFGRSATAGDLTVKHATLVPDRSIWGNPLREMGDAWRRDTGGRVTLRIYPDGIAGDEPDMVRKMRIGQLQAATLTVGGLVEITPAFTAFEIPMFFDSNEELAYVLERTEPFFREKLREKGFILLHWAQGGWLHLFTTRPVVKLEEFKKLDLFVWAGNDEMVSWWKRSGFRPVPLAATDIVVALQTGMVEALPVTPLAALSLQWFRSTPNMIDLPFAPLVGATIMTQRAWSRVSDADRESVLAAAVEAGRRLDHEVPIHDAAAIMEMRSRGLTVVPVLGTQAEPEWRRAAGGFADKMRESFIPDDVFELVLEARDEYRARMSR